MHKTQTSWNRYMEDKYTNKDFAPETRNIVTDMPNCVFGVKRKNQMFY